MNLDCTIDGTGTKLAQRSAKYFEGFVSGAKKRANMPTEEGRVVHVDISKQSTGRLALACF